MTIDIDHLETNVSRFTAAHEDLEARVSATMTVSEEKRWREDAIRLATNLLSQFREAATNLIALQRENRAMTMRWNSVAMEVRGLECFDKNPETGEPCGECRSCRIREGFGLLPIQPDDSPEED